MNLTKEQARRVALALYPAIWKTNRIEAIAKAIEFISDAAQLEGGSNSHKQAGGESASKANAIVRQLSEHMKHHRTHVKVVARSIGVSGYTVRTWLEGKYKPSEENLQKITDFLSSFQPAQEGALSSET